MNWIDWLTGIGRQRDIEQMARAVWHQLELAPKPRDPKLITDDFVRTAIDASPEPTDAELRQLMARISALTRQQRRCLKLHFIEKLTYRQVAERLGIPRGLALRELTHVMHSLIVSRVQP